MQPLGAADTLSDTEKQRSSIAGSEVWKCGIFLPPAAHGAEELKYNNKDGRSWSAQSRDYNQLHFVSSSRWSSVTLSLRNNFVLICWDGTESVIIRAHYVSMKKNYTFQD